MLTCRALISTFRNIADMACESEMVNRVGQ
jgi:hypothetical protein